MPQKTANMAHSSQSAMDDEYGVMDKSGETFILDSYKLEQGTILDKVPIRYKTFGTLNAARSNCMVVCHALTGNASLDSWWGGMMGKGKPFDDTQFYIVCANVLGKSPVLFVVSLALNRSKDLATEHVVQQPLTPKRVVNMVLTFRT